MESPADPGRAQLLGDALAVARTLGRLDLTATVARRLGQVGLVASGGGPVDVVAVGKAAPELVRAARRALGERVARQILVHRVEQTTTSSTAKSSNGRRARTVGGTAAGRTSKE